MCVTRASEEICLSRNIGILDCLTEESVSLLCPFSHALAVRMEVLVYGIFRPGTTGVLKMVERRNEESNRSVFVVALALVCKMLYVEYIHLLLHESIIIHMNPHTCRKTKKLPHPARNFPVKSAFPFSKCTAPLMDRNAPHSLPILPYDSQIPIRCWICNCIKRSPTPFPFLFPFLLPFPSPFISFAPYWCFLLNCPINFALGVFVSILYRHMLGSMPGH